MSIKIQTTFYFLVALLCILNGLPSGLALVAILFGIVVAHELGHLAVVKLLGYKTSGIIWLHALGGTLVIEDEINQKMMERPLHHFLIAVGGPLVNVVFLFGSGLYMALTNYQLAEQIPSNAFYAPLEYFIFYNFALLVFNLFPIFPMDGGRILYSISSFFLGDGAKTLTWIFGAIASVTLFGITFSIGAYTGMLVGAVGFGINVYYREQLFERNYEK
jgi:stage IV sporulation protein FB